MERKGEGDLGNSHREFRRSSLDPTGPRNSIVYPLHLLSEERKRCDRFKRALRPRRTCSSKLYKTRLHASAMSLSLCKRVTLCTYVRTGARTRSCKSEPARFAWTAHIYFVSSNLFLQFFWLRSSCRQCWISDRLHTIAVRNINISYKVGRYIEHLVTYAIAQKLIPLFVSWKYIYW